MSPKDCHEATYALRDQFTSFNLVMRPWEHNEFDAILGGLCFSAFKVQARKCCLRNREHVCVANLALYFGIASPYDEYINYAYYYNLVAIVSARNAP